MTDMAHVLLRGVLEDPADDLPRLALADWWEETGADPDRAEFVRLQVLPAPTSRHRESLVRGCSCQRCRWLSRPSDLIPGHGLRWLGFDPGWGPPRGPLRGEMPQGIGWGIGRHFLYRRGFVTHARLPCADFLRLAPALFGAQPVTSVTLTDRGPPVGRSMPRRPEYRVAWYLDRRASRLAALADVAVARDLVPAKLFRLLRGGSAHGGARTYPDESDALAALSAACVARGRRAAGLPPLP